jgi:hypothetical protein
MRTTPIFGKKVWFGPRRLGWGWEPVSPEGWFTTFAIVALSMGLRRAKLRSAWLKYGLGGGFLLLAFLKGTAPGGPSARSDYEAGKLAALQATTPQAAESD